MKYINRWALMRNTITENIAEHSLEVAMIAHCLATVRNTYYYDPPHGGSNVSEEPVDVGRVCLLAMYHDASEIITGDMPTPVKYYAPEIRDAYKKVEHMASEKLLAELPEEMQAIFRPIMIAQPGDKELWRIVKAADKISALVKCVEEVSMGNQDFASAEQTTRQAIEDMHLPEADFFLEHFLPSYRLDLDRQAAQEAGQKKEQEKNAWQTYTQLSSPFRGRG
ncbi:MAG: 5'-deoxynucleotidase [Lachnospiraceae bacterium]|nr:5'-deoxynucleotidase [Lachnospiraceae bacterium]